MFISFKTYAQETFYSLDYTDSLNNVNKYTDSSRVLPAIRKKLLTEINNINSNIHKIFKEDINKDFPIEEGKTNSIKLSPNNINIFLFGYYQEIDKNVNNSITSKYYFLVSIPKIIRGHLLKELKYYNYFLAVQNIETVNEDELSNYVKNIKGSIDIYSQNKYWPKLKSFKREILVNEFKPFDEINKGINNFIRQ